MDVTRPHPQPPRATTALDAPTAAPLAPRVVHRDAAEALWFFGARIWITATAEQTGGAYGLIDHVMPPGMESPWHVHHAEDETFFVVEGTVAFLVGAERITAVPGTYIFGPRGIPHGFRVVGDTPARMLLMANPGGFEQFALALAEPAQGPGFPPPGPPDMGRVMAAAAQYGVDILGPLPA